MKFDLRDFPADQSVFTCFPVLTYYPVFRQPVEGPNSNESLIRYILYVYSPDSELKTVSDLQRKREMAIELSGLHQHEALLEKITGGDDTINAMVVAFFKLTKHRKFTRYMCTLEAYYELMDRMRTPVDPSQGKLKMTDDAVMRAYSVKTELTLDAKKMEKELDDLELELFQEDDKLKEVVDADSTMIQSDFTKGRAESLADKVASRKKKAHA